MRIRGSTPPLAVWLCGLLVVSASGCAGAKSAPVAGSKDVVMTGYGTQDRASVTGSVSSVTAEDLKNVRAQNTAELLWGRVPGLNVIRRGDGSYALRVRGVASFQGTDDPLVVVDGVPLMASRDLWSINPMDIARVDVLKDASTTALYGFRGSNGVVVITTKRGR